MSSLRTVATALLVACVPAGVACAQTLRIVPSISITETYSDNLELVSGDLVKRGWYAIISPGLRIDLNAARAKGFAGFQYNDVLFHGQSQLDNTQKTLYSRLTLEAIERWLWLDARADITQQNLSPFGASVTPDQPTINRNRVETTTIQVAPIIRGRLSDTANYAAKYNAAQVRTNETLFGVANNLSPKDTKSGEFSARVFGSRPGARFNWALEVNDLAIRNDLVDTKRDSRARATLIYEAAPNLKFSASGGYEKSDFDDPETEGVSTPGIGFTWIPSERSQAAAFVERRFFGTGHSLLLSHRTPRTAWRIASVKEAAVLPTGVSSTSAGSIGGLMSYLLISAIPDPEAREAAVRRRLEEFGFGDNSILTSGTVNFRPYVYRNSTATAAFLGTRHALSLVYADREERYTTPSIAADIGTLADNRQRGFTLDGSRRLTPLTTLRIFGRALRTDGLAQGAPETRQKDYGLSLSSRFGGHATFAVGARRASFTTTLPVGGYRENSVFMTLSFQT